jgi:three-Cys-motif partner protein
MAKKRKKFFSRQTEASRRKAKIIADYFPAWATVIGSRATKMAYIDLYAGRGLYDDGTESTPLLVLRHAISHPKVREMLVPIFNDNKHADELRANIEKLPEIDKLKFKPAVYGMEVAEETVTYDPRPVDEAQPELPDTSPIDKLALRLLRDFAGKTCTVRDIFETHSGDRRFIDNYNRINMGITNKKVGKHMEALFGPERGDVIDVPGASPGHHLPHDLKTLEVLRHEDQAVARAPVELQEPERPDELCADFLEPALQRVEDHPLAQSRSQTRYSVTQVGQPLERNYKEALRRLETDGRVSANPPASARKRRKGKPTMAGHITITFPD